MKTLVLLCGITLTASAQPVSFGVLGGVPITDAFQTFHGNQASYATNTKRYVVGATLQFNLPLRFSLEVDGLYRRLGYQYQQSGPKVTARTVANSWEFPAVIKFNVLPGPVRPFVDAGASFRHISGIDEVRTVINTAGNAVETTFNTAPEFHKRNDIGLVFGGGVEFKLGGLRIAPQLRYTRWGSENFRDPVNSLLRTNRNQGDFLLSLTF